MPCGHRGGRCRIRDLERVCADKGDTRWIVRGEKFCVTNSVRHSCAQFVRCFEGFAREYVRLCLCSLVPCHRIWPMMIGFLWKSQKCCSGLASIVVLQWHSMGCRHKCWSMHQESPPRHNSNRPLFLTSNFCQPRMICSPFFEKWHGFCRARICGFAPPPPPRTRNHLIPCHFNTPPFSLFLDTHHTYCLLPVLHLL